MVCDEILLDPRPLAHRASACCVLGASGHPGRGESAPPESWAGPGCPGCVGTLPPQPVASGCQREENLIFYKINSNGAVFLAECGSNNRPLIEKGN